MVLEPPQLLTTNLPVLTADGGRGRLQLALLDPGRWRLLAFVIRYGALRSQDVIVPLERVAAITDRQVRLWLSRGELEQQPVYRSTARAELVQSGPQPALVAIQYGSAGTSERIVSVPSSTALGLMQRQTSLTDRLVPLRVGQAVRIDTQRIGRLAGLLLDAEWSLRQLVVRTGYLFGRNVIVPIDQVADWDSQQIWLKLDRAAFDQLPEYRSDSAIKQDVEQELRSNDHLRRLDAQTIDVSVTAGIVTLRGHAVAGVSPVRAEHVARRVPGVLGVVNEIITDGELHLAVVQALERDKRTRGLPVIVYVQRGVVFLHGEPVNSAMRTALEMVVGSVPGVRAVVCRPEGSADQDKDQRALFPRIGQEVYTARTRLGQVERVVIHPRHRRVTAMVVQAQTGNRQGPVSFRLEPAAPSDRPIVIPMSAVREVTEGAVLLEIDDDAALSYAEHDPAAYAPPPPGWQPPYPYAHADVLIERRRSLAAGERFADVATVNAGAAAH